MIVVLQRGKFVLFETKAHVKIVFLDNKSYLWITIGGFEELVYETSLTTTTKKKEQEGVYRMYQVKNEKNLSDNLHLELNDGFGQWQGYLLPDGLPTEPNQSKKIIATQELITN